MGVWPGPDAGFLSVLYDEIAEGKYGVISGKQQSIVGYSSGAFFASRLIAEWPGLRTASAKSWPSVAAAVIVCGGSYEAYCELQHKCHLFQKDSNENAC